MLKHTSALKLALERQANKEAISSSMEELADDTNMTDGEAVDEVDAAEEAADAASDQADDLEDAAAGLESIYQTILAMSKDGKIERSTIGFLNVAAESYSARAGITGNDVLAIKGNVLSTEAIKERIAEIWQKIVGFIKRVAYAVWNFLKNIFGATKRLRTYANKLANAQFTNEPAKNATIDISGFGNRLALGNAVIADPKKGSSDLIKMLQESVKTDEDSSKRLTNARAAVRVYINSGGQRAVESVAKAIGERDQVPSFFIPHTSDGVTGWTTAQLIGNVVFTATLPMVTQSEGDSFNLKFRKYFFNARISKDVLPSKLPSKIMVKTRSQADIRVGAAGLMAILDTIDKEVAPVQNDRKRFLDGLDDLVARTKKTDGSLTNDALAVFRVYSAFERAIGGLTAKIAAHAVSTAQAYIALLNKSASQYTLVKPDAAAAPAAA